VRCLLNTFCFQIERNRPLEKLVIGQPYEQAIKPTYAHYEAIKWAIGRAASQAQLIGGKAHDIHAATLGARKIVQYSSHSASVISTGPVVGCANCAPFAMRE